VNTNKGASSVVTATVEAASQDLDQPIHPADSQGAAFTSVSHVVTIATPPNLTITLTNKQVVLAWPTSAETYLLQTTTNPVSQASWGAMTDLPLVNGPSNTVTAPITNTTLYFGLQSQ
jgi:hypothetical protein